MAFIFFYNVCSRSCFVNELCSCKLQQLWSCLFSNFIYQVPKMTYICVGLIQSQLPYPMNYIWLWFVQFLNQIYKVFMLNLILMRSKCHLNFSCRKVTYYWNNKCQYCQCLADDKSNKFIAKWQVRHFWWCLLHLL